MNPRIDPLANMDKADFAEALAAVENEKDFSKFAELFIPRTGSLPLGEFYERMAIWLERSMAPGSDLPPPPEKPNWQWVGRLFYGAVFEVED